MVLDGVNMRKTIKITLVLILSMFSFILKPKADVVLDIYSPVGDFRPHQTNAILNMNGNWGNGSVSAYSNVWLVSAGQYFSAGGVNGSNLIVSADYYLGVKGLPSMDVGFNNFMNTTRNTLTSSNLRCGIGDYHSGYDNTYVPVVTNFSATYEEASHQYGNYFRVHIKFDYSQRIQSVTKAGTNISCWFVQNPSNGLFMQPSMPLGNQTVQYFAYTNSLRFAVTDDPNTKLLNEITNQNQTIIDQNNQTNNKLDDLNNNIKDDDIDTSNSNSFFDNFNDKDHGGISTVVTAPLNAIVKITEKCKPISFEILEKNIVIPCGDTLFWNKPEVETFRSIWNVIIGGSILYALLIKLYKVIESLKNPDDDRIEVVKL